MGRKKTSGPDFWPALDRALYIDGVKRGFRRTGQRRFLSLSPATLKGIHNDYGASLQWLRGRGSLIGEIQPAMRWPYAVLEDMAVDMLSDGYSVATVHSRIGRLKRALAVMQPEVSLNHFDALRREFEPPKPRFDPIVWKVTAADLQAYGIE